MSHLSGIAIVTLTKAEGKTLVAERQFSSHPNHFHGMSLRSILLFADNGIHLDVLFVLTFGVHPALKSVHATLETVHAKSRVFP